MVFSGRSVIVTGAGSGIGRALAVGFCADGAQVMGIGRRQSHLEETSQLCAAGRMQFVAGDVAQPDDVERLFSEAVRLYDSNDKVKSSNVASLCWYVPAWSRGQTSGRGYEEHRKAVCGNRVKQGFCEAKTRKPACTV